MTAFGASCPFQTRLAKVGSLPTRAPIGESCPDPAFRQGTRMEQMGGTRPLWTDLREYVEDGAE
jgi:hypothetical protein